MPSGNTLLIISICSGWDCQRDDPMIERINIKINERNQPHKTPRQNFPLNTIQKSTPYAMSSKIIVIIFPNIIICSSVMINNSIYITDKGLLVRIIFMIFCKKSIFWQSTRKCVFCTDFFTDDGHHSKMMPHRIGNEFDRSSMVRFLRRGLVRAGG